ncbi:MAG: endopeptidase La [Victivallaceae bacterium]|nr:endopeptidase La [Victivallaceae bacterium]
MADSSSITIGNMPNDGGSAIYFDLGDPIIFPHGLTPIPVENEETRAVIGRALTEDRLLAVFPELPPRPQLDALPDRYEFRVFEFSGKAHAANGVLARIVKKMDFPDGTTRAVLRGICRIAFESMFRDREGLLRVRYKRTPDVTDESPEESGGHLKSVQSLFQQLISLGAGAPEELQNSILSATDAGRAADQLADELNFRLAEKFFLMLTPSVKKRLSFLTILLNRELETTRLGIKIQNDVHEAVGEQQREFYLREQLRTIQQELGEDTRNPDIAEIEDRLKKSELPEETAKVAEKELSRLALLPTSSPEYHISYTYISWLLDLPWRVFTEDRLDCATARRVLDEDHFGLEDVKKRILEFLAVLQLRGKGPDQKAPILCLVGPPGVGKTSLGKSIARAMNRKFIRMSLGGVRDEAEIRGHRRTYVGAMPGRILQNLKRAGSNNPVFMLDEVDKLAHDFRGDPASALLEVLDPAQNNSFNDNYLEIGYDLSKIFFIATANVAEDIPAPLLDRMEVIRLPGYTVLEKREIARRFLAPRQIEANGLDFKRIHFLLPAIDEIINHYTLEAGVRNLERTIAQLCRRIAGKIVGGEISASETVRIDKAMVGELLGSRKVLLDKAVRFPEPGRAVGLAWTGAGGAILPVEFVALPGGKGNLKLTGSLGKVMQESAETAFSVVRAAAADFGISPDYFTGHDFHLHVPDGATPKDGPSAGITMTTAMLSLALGKPLRSDLAMTGEITLHGRVTAVGGIREKTVAALRAGIRTVLMPAENRKDYEELPEEVRGKLKFFFISDYRDALKKVFAGGETK